MKGRSVFACVVRLCRAEQVEIPLDDLLRADAWVIPEKSGDSSGFSSSPGRFCFVLLLVRCKAAIEDRIVALVRRPRGFRGWFSLLSILYSLLSITGQFPTGVRQESAQDSSSLLFLRHLRGTRLRTGHVQKRGRLKWGNFRVFQGSSTA
jgi:hypothetical protein